MKKGSFIYSTFILIVVNFIVRFFGFAYRILLSRMVGSEAIGLYHLVFPILMLLITFASAGIPVAVSKLVAHYASLNMPSGCRKVLSISVVLGLIISSLLSLLLYLNGHFIAEKLIKNQDIYSGLMALIPAILLIPLSSIVRGYYYGMKNVGPPGVSQILEQLFRIAFVIGILTLFPPKTPKEAATIAILGISIGEFAGLLWLVIAFKDIRIAYVKKTYHQLTSPRDGLISKIILIAAPITATRLVSVLIQSINAALIPQRLVISGLSAQEAISTFGKLTGMAMPLLFLPFIVTSALVVNIIPSVAEEITLKHWHQLRMKCNLAIRMTLLVSIPLMALLIFYAEPLCLFLYQQEDVGTYLSFLGYGTVFLSLQHTLSGILHGMGKQVITTFNYLLGMGVQLVCTYYLVPNPSFRVNGFILGFLLSSILICTLNYICLNRFIQLKLRLFNDIGKPIFATIIMILFLLNLNPLFLRFHLSPQMSMASSLLFSLLSFLILIFSTGCISIRTIWYMLLKK
ncbi:MAG: stage V sporulation protein B [Thermotaleaceae bacterium]